MRILVATDAWHPQVNGVVRTLSATATAAAGLGARLLFVTPDDFRSLPLLFYPEIRLSLPQPMRVAQIIEQAQFDAIHIATEGPIGLAVRRYALRRELPFTTSFHTRFPDYLAARLPVPPSWAWSWLRRFHDAASCVMASTPALKAELEGRGFHSVAVWPRGVDTGLFRPQALSALDHPRPIFLNVGRFAVEKNLDAFLSLDLPGTKIVVGDGPAREGLMRRHPAAIFLGALQGEALAEIYASADVFVFPSRTDTYGLVLLEAMASGLPVAAFPAPGPRDVIGDSAAGVLDEDLRTACLRALAVPRDLPCAFAQGFSWEASAHRFLSHIAEVAPTPASQRSRRRRFARQSKSAEARAA